MWMSRVGASTLTHTGADNSSRLPRSRPSTVASTATWPVRDEAAASKAVSYTHLDVYKRQVPEIMELNRLMARRAVFPFTAIVNQERMKRALILNAVSPRIGGVLIRGERGTAKSTAARALAALLPDITVLAGSRYNCDPERPDEWSDCLLYTSRCV